MKALTDEHRLRAIAALRGRELCLCQLVELLELATSTVSRHMSILQQARIVDSRKDGRWTYFRLAERTASEEARQAAALGLASIGRDPQIRKDAKRLRQILKTDREVLCRRQSE
jgi:DNA-binding transcriptional ArsR family regulator